VSNYAKLGTHRNSRIEFLDYLGLLRKHTPASHISRCSRASKFFVGRVLFDTLSPRSLASIPAKQAAKRSGLQRICSGPLGNNNAWYVHIQDGWHIHRNWVWLHGDVAKLPQPWSFSAVHNLRIHTHHLFSMSPNWILDAALTRPVLALSRLHAMLHLCWGTADGLVLGLLGPCFQAQPR